MPSKKQHNPSTPFSPISLLDELLEEETWECDYQDETEIHYKFSQDWGVCSMGWLWVQEWETLSCAVKSDLYIPDERQDDIRDLILMMNEQIWVGHFDLSQDVDPVFRYSLLLKGLSRKQLTGMIEATIEIALREWNRYHAAFHFVSWGGAESSQKMLSPSLIETAGQA